MAAPTDYVLYLPLYRSDLKGTTITSKDSNAHACTVTGTTWSPQGRILDGIDDSVISAASTAFEVTSSTGFALEGWFNKTAANLQMLGIGISNDTLQTQRMELWIQNNDASSNVVRLFSSGGGGGTTTAISAGVWHHLVVSQAAGASGAGALVYLDGALYASIAVLGYPTWTSGTIKACIGNNGNSLPFKGIFGEARIYNRGLSAGEISDLYNEGKETYKDAPVRVFIDDTRVKVRNSQINIDSRIDERSVANFTVVDTPGTASYDRAQRVNIYDNAGASTGTAIFSGFIDTPDSLVLSPSGALLHDISCIDNHYLADKRIAAKIWTNKSSASMISELITDYLASEGVSAGTIQTGETLTRVVANYVPVSDVIDAIAEANGFIWYIDSDKILQFLDRTTNTASFSLTASNVLNNPAPRYAKGNQQYRNIQWIRGGTDTTNQTERFLGDSALQSFLVGFPINQTPSVTLNSVSQSIGIKGVDSGKNFYWNKGDPVIYADTSPSSNASVQVQYVGQYKTITMVRNDLAVASQLAVEGSGTGQVENTIVNTDLDSRVGAQEFGEAKLTQWCQNAEKFHFTTRTAGLQAGQLLNVTFSPFGFTSYDMLVESVNTMANDEELRYNVTAVTGPVMGSWAQLFKSFARQPLISLGQDEQVILLRQQRETLPVSETATVYTDSISGNVVNRWLNSAPISRGSLDNVQHEIMTTSDVIQEHWVTEKNNYYWA